MYVSVVINKNEDEDRLWRRRPWSKVIRLGAFMRPSPLYSKSRHLLLVPLRLESAPLSPSEGHPDDLESNHYSAVLPPAYGLCCPGWSTRAAAARARSGPRGVAKTSRLLKLKGPTERNTRSRDPERRLNAGSVLNPVGEWGSG